MDMDGEMERLLNRFTMSSHVYITVRLILWAIEKNGLEKTLEDLREVCPAIPDAPEPNDVIYRGFLHALGSVKRIVQEGRSIREGGGEEDGEGV